MLIFGRCLVEILKLKFDHNLCKILKLKFGQDFESEHIGQDFEAEVLSGFCV